MLLKRISTIAAKVEGTIGTAETLTASEGVFNAYDVEIQGNIEVQEREDPGGFNRRKGSAAARSGSMSFKTDIQWDGTATPPAWASVLLPGCGWVDSTSTFTPRSEAPGSNVKTLTLAHYEDGVKKTLAGAVGNFNFVFPSGQVAYVEWSFEGVWQPVTTTAIISPTYPTDDLIRFAGGTCTWGGVVQVVAQVGINSGNTIKMREDVTTDAGFISGIITDRSPMISLDPESELTTTDDRFGDWIANTEAAFALTLGDTLTFSAPKGQIVNVQEADRDKLQTDNVEIRCNKNGATKDEELSITFA